MENATINFSPQNLVGLIWRPIIQDDLLALAELARICHLADGGLGFLWEPDILQSCYFPGTPGAAIGAFALDESLVTCTSVHIGVDSDTQQIIIVGLERPV